MKQRMLPVRATVALAICVVLGGCQLVKKLTGRGGEDAGTSRSSGVPILGDAGLGSPSIGLPMPNPQVVPLNVPTMPTMPNAGDAGAMAMPVADSGAMGAGAGDGDAGGPSIAVVDAGTAGTDDPRGRGSSYYRNYCKEHPGRVHPVTRVLCPF